MDTYSVLVNVIVRFIQRQQVNNGLIHIPKDTCLLISDHLSDRMRWSVGLATIVILG